MGFNVICKEILKVKNINEQTKNFLKEVKKYLLENLKGIVELNVDIDGVNYDSTKDKFLSDNMFDKFIVKSSLFYQIFSNVENAKIVSYNLLYDNMDSLSFAFKFEKFFENYFNMNEIKDNVLYKCIEYYDYDEDVMMYSFDENGGQYIDYDKNKSDIEDIKEWVSYNFILQLSTKKQENNNDIYDKTNKLIENINKLFEHNFQMDICDKLEECGEIGLNLINEKIKSENIDKLIRLVNEFVVEIQNKDVDFKFILSLIPDGDEDYAFASTLIIYENEKIVTKFARF